MQASALLLHWGGCRWARNLWVLIIYFSSRLCCPLKFQCSPQILWWEYFLVFGNISFFKWLPSWDRSLSLLLLSLFLSFIVFFYLLLKTMDCFSGCLMSSAGFQSCFVEFTRRLNVLLMNLWGRKCSPRRSEEHTSELQSHHCMKLRCQKCL